MGQHHLRQERNCLNCGAIVEDRFCSHCGQENLEPKESLGHLIGHFFSDITHFDSKLFLTLKDLVFRPGYLTREYAAGRRATFLHPIRMYVFISAVFFLLLYSGMEQEAPAMAEINVHGVNLFRQQFADSLRDAGRGLDGVRRGVFDNIASRLDTAQVLRPGLESLGLNMSDHGVVMVDIVENKYRTIREFDSLQARLPDSSREHGSMRWLLRNNIRLKEEHGGRSALHIETNVQHTIPKLMFVFLPLFALYVRLFYWRKKFVYSQYAIFSVHFHSFYFLVMMAAVLLARPFDSVSLDLGLPFLVFVLAFVYLVAALRNMFGDSRWVAFGKAVAISVLYSVTIAAANVAVMVITFLRS